MENRANLTTEEQKSTFIADFQDNEFPEIKLEAIPKREPVITAAAVECTEEICVMCGA